MSRFFGEIKEVKETSVYQEKGITYADATLIMRLADEEDFLLDEFIEVNLNRIELGSEWKYSEIIQWYEKDVVNIINFKYRNRQGLFGLVLENCAKYLKNKN